MIEKLEEQETLIRLINNSHDSKLLMDLITDLYGDNLIYRFYNNNKHKYFDIKILHYQNLKIN